MLRANKLLISTFILLFVVLLNTGINQAEERCYVMTVTANVEYKDTWLLQWDPDNPEEINRNSSVSVKVIGGWKRFSWSVSGNDFWFDSAHTITSTETDSRTVTVYAGSSACGAATIAATDSRNGSVTGYLRCNYGRWILKSDHLCEFPGPATKVTVYFQTRMVGNKLQESRWQGWASGVVDCDWCSDHLPAGCFDEPCVTWPGMKPHCYSWLDPPEPGTYNCSFGNYLYYHYYEWECGP